MERLDKFLASQGFGSRKQVQSLIKGGSVMLNGETIKKPDTKLNPKEDAVSVNGQAVRYQKYIYIMMNKPAGVVSATKDNFDKTVLDILPKEFMRPNLFPAGRLDKDTEGLLIITDDGDFAHRMLSPAKHVDKTYIALLDGEITEETVKRFEEGIVFADGTICKSARLEKLSSDGKPRARVTISEGKYHQVKKMFICCGLNVVHLQRISIGNLYLDSNLPIGGCKLLTDLDKESVFIGKVH